MRVYRIQDANNIGPMHYKSVIRQNIRHHNDPDMMQGLRDGKPFSPQIGGSTGRFAWSDLHDLYGFIKYPRAVDNAGYTVVVYEIDVTTSVLYPDGQVMFYPEHAVKVDEFLYTEVGKKLMGMG